MKQRRMKRGSIKKLLRGGASQLRHFAWEGLYSMKGQLLSAYFSSHPW